MKIIFADDDMITRMVMKSILDSLQMVYYSCKDGKEAYGIIVQNCHYYDVIIADYQMPHLNGCELFFKVRKQMGLKTPFVMISSTEEKQIIYQQNGIKCFDYFVKKPLTKDKIEKVIEQIQSDEEVRKKYLGENTI